MGFSYCSKASLKDDDVRSRIILQNYTLFELGMNATEVKKLQDHFETALHDYWVEGQVLEQYQQRFADLRAIFVEESMHVPSVIGAARMIISARTA